ncbi:MAG: hypothetical protein KIT31_13390 [Deltaproteobacteria bacterium]|nr:hypothetical protein [Deltaproteobacteria bacterium]
MRLRVALVGILLALAGPAAADKVKTNQDAKLYSRAGEQGQVIMKVKEGQSMTILSTDGRWLKVRVSGRTGFIPRSKVNLPEGEDDLVRNTRRRPFVDGRGTKRGFGGGAPDDRVGADAVGNGSGGRDSDSDSDTDTDDPDDKPVRKKPPKETSKDRDRDKDDDEDIVIKDDERPTVKVLVKTSVYSEADDESDEQFSAAKGELLFPTGKKKGKFVEVENDEGDIGFVLGSKLSMTESSGGGGGKGGRTMDARARLGFNYLQQGVRSAGGTGANDNYNLGTAAVAVSLGGTVLYPYKPRYKLGADVGYDFAKAVPGIQVMGGTTGITLHNFAMRAVGAYDLQKSNGMMLLGRLGIAYQSFQVSDVENLAKNTARLPSENITSPTLGVGVVIPRLKPKIGARLTLDTQIGASVTQTKNLEDGVNPGAKRVSLNAGITYKWKPDMDIVAAYDLNYTTLSFGEPVMNSQRAHTGTAVNRTDLFNALTIGIGKVF